MRTLSLSALAPLAVALFVSGCSETVTAEPLYYPPPSFVATAIPIYFEGHPNFWYNDHWYFREGSGWAYYRQEPGFLFHARAEEPPPAHQVARVVPPAK